MSNPDHSITTDEESCGFLDQFEKADQNMEALQALYPHAFDGAGRALVAVAQMSRSTERFHKLGEKQ